jgi:hypothetical protein
MSRKRVVYFTDFEWLTLGGCASALAKSSGSPPKGRIRQELLVGMLNGVIRFRHNSHRDEWTPDDFKDAAIGKDGKSRGFAELLIAGDDPEAIDKLTSRRWQDYSLLFRKTYLNRFELETKSVEAFFRARQLAKPPSGSVADPAAGSRPRTGDAERTKRIKAVVSFARDYGKGTPDSIRAMSVLIISQQKHQGFSDSTLRKILGGRYGPMKQLGLRGWKT